MLMQITIPFGPGAYVFIAVYLFSLLLIGWAGFRARKNNTLADFYLAGRGFSLPVLLMTLYATQYSGNTMFGFTGKTYRLGYSWIVCVHFMTAIIVAYLLFAPKLHVLSKRYGFVTPTDFLAHRYQHKGVNLLATVLMIYALGNYAMAQFVAMGRAFQGLAAAQTTGVFVTGVIMLAIIMGIYETLGGMRSVAWTDVIQGVILLIGFAAMLVMVFKQFGSLSETTRAILESGPEIRRKALPPDAAACRNWLSYILLVGLGGALYPQAIQRLYAARSLKTLKRSMMCMAFLPLTTTLVAVIVGAYAIVHAPGLEGPDSDSALTLLCRQVTETTYGYWLVVLLFSAMLAAIMSTADSALLTISSMVCKDLYGVYVKADLPEEELAKLGKTISWGLIGVLVVAAIALRNEATLIQLLERKFDMLLQLVPAFMLGVHWKRLGGGPVFVGMLVGALIATALVLAGHTTVWGFHAGLVALPINLSIAVGGSLLGNAPSPGTTSHAK